jgi:hypothetical protein
MCEPLTIASLALSGGSVLSGMLGNQQQQEARDRALAAENTRSSGYESQANNLFQQTLAKTQKPVYDKSVADEAASRTASDSKLIDSTGNIVPVTGSAPEEVGQSIARAGARAITRGKEQAKLNAAVGANAGVNQKLGIDLAHDGEWQNIFGGNIRRSAAILPLELQDANRAGAGLRGLGSILSAGAGATGALAGAADAPKWGTLFGGSTPVAMGTPAGMAVPHGARQAGVFERVFS